jgi:hypothetical protein
MSENGIPIVEKFTRPLLAIFRNFQSEQVKQEAATIFFVNEFGFAITTAETIYKYLPLQTYYDKYQIFKEKCASQTVDIEELKVEFGYNNKEAIIDLKPIFLNCSSSFERVNFIIHPKYNLGVLHFEKATDFAYSGYAKFLHGVENIQKGKELMRLGYPFPESSNYFLNKIEDQIEWDLTKPFVLDSFPLKGIITRKYVNANEIDVIEMNSAGFKGHEGSPLFDENGLIYGMHFSNSNFSNSDNTFYPNALFGNCITSKIITDFLSENGIKYYQIENGKEVIYNDNFQFMKEPLVPTIFMSGEDESSVKIYELNMTIDNQLLVDYKEPFQVGINKMDGDSKKESAALAQFSLDGKNEIFITEENAGSVKFLTKDNNYKLSVLKKEVSSSKWKVQTKVKFQRNFGFEYFDIIAIRRNKGNDRDHTNDPHIAFYPDASGKYIRYDNEKSIKVVTKKIITGQESAILPLHSKIVAEEFEIDINYTLDEKLLTIFEVSILDK